MSDSAADLRGALHRFGLERDRLNGAICHEAGIAAADLAALEHLELSGPITPRQLRDRLLLTSGAMTALTDRLEAAGWITRRPHPTDRRSVLLELTPTAANAVPARVLAYHQAIAKATKTLTAAERKALIGLLDAAATAARVTTTALVQEVAARDASREG